MLVVLLCDFVCYTTYFGVLGSDCLMFGDLIALLMFVYVVIS